MPDVAAISITIAAAALFLALVIEFFAWVRVRFETKAEVKACQLVQENAETSYKAMKEAFDAWNAKVYKDVSTSLAKASAEAERANLRADNIAESLAALTNKVTARDREEARREKRAAQEASYPDALPPDVSQETFFPAPTAPNGRIRFAKKG